MNLSLVMLLISPFFLLGYDEEKTLVEASSKTITQSSHTGLDSRIPSDDPNKYKSILDAKEWQNPYLVIQKDGIAFKCLAISQADWQMITPEGLRQRLIELPVTAWPYGRVIGVQVIGIRYASDEEGIAANKEKVNSVLKSLGVKNYLWPSA